MSELKPRSVLVLGLIAGALGMGTLGGCIIVVGGRGHADHPKSRRVYTSAPAPPSAAGMARATRTLRLEHIPGAELDVSTEAGDIIVRLGEGDGDVVVEARLLADGARRLERVEIAAERDEAGALTIHPVWPDGKRAGETCTFVIQTPDAGEMRLRTDKGSTTVVEAGADAAATNSINTNNATARR